MGRTSIKRGACLALTIGLVITALSGCEIYQGNGFAIGTESTRLNAVTFVDVTKFVDTVQDDNGTAAAIAGALGTSAVVYAQVAPTAVPDPAAEVPEPPTVLEDWCEFMGAAFGPGLDAPNVRTAFATAIQTATPAPATAYVTLLDGIPTTVEVHLVPLRSAEHLLEQHQAVASPSSVLASAAQVDAYRSANCPPA